MPEEATTSCEQWGFFDDTRGEFVLTTPRPPRHWKNILWNPRYNTQPTQAGAGISYRRDEDGGIVLLNWSGERVVYVVDVDSGEVFAAGYHPVCNDAAERFTCRFGRGYQIIEQVCLGIRVRWEMVVPPEGCTELHRLTVENVSGRHRRLRVVGLIDINLNVQDPYFGATNRYRPAVDASRRVLAVYNDSHRADRQWNAILAASTGVEDFCFERSEFLDAYSTLERPSGLAGPLPSAVEEVDDPIIATGWSCELDGGELWRLNLAFGNQPEAAAGIEPMAEQACDAAFEAAMGGAADIVRGRESAFSVETPDGNFNRFVNIWLPHQLAYCAQWNRGWGKGFRDGMQDAWAWAMMDPDHVRAMIVDALPHQYADGRTLRKWAPIDRKEYNDGPVWLAMAVHAYVAETGDIAFLRSDHGFFESDERGSVLEHLRRGMATLYERRGERGLCLMPYGDWNDQLTGPGKGGRGESVWTSMAFAAALPKVAALAERAGDGNLANWCEAARRDVVEAIRTNAWNGQWFNRATTDAGDAIGHPGAEFGRVFLLPQAWAILADVADASQREAVLAAVDEHLLAEHGYLLLTPPWRRHDEAVGELSSRRPGVVENGSNYCHASAFMIAALAEAGQVDKALDVWTRVLPTNPANPPSCSGQEPFSVTNSYRGPAAGRSAGRSLFSWRTGTAGWMLRDAVEGILGVRTELDGLRISRRLPSEWDAACLRRRYRGMDVTIRFRRTGQPSLSVGGETLDGNLLPVEMLVDGVEIICDV